MRREQVLTREIIRQHSKKLVLGVGLLVFVFILVGCSANISMSIDPNPINFNEDKLTEDITVTLRTSGIGSVDIDYMNILVLDNEDEEVYSETVEIEESSFVVPGVEVKESFEINLCEDFIDATEFDEDEIDDELCSELYEEQLQGKEYKLRLVLHGSISPTAEADIIFE